jgi:hypothetical protein
MLKSFNFRRSLGGQPREGVVHGPNPCTYYRPLPLPSPPPHKIPHPQLKAPPFPSSPHFSPPPLPPFFLPPFPLALGGRPKGRGVEGGWKGGEGGLGIPPCSSLSKANPAPSLGRAAKFWG